jgi:hypothetical protein
MSGGSQVLFRVCRAAAAILVLMASGLLASIAVARSTGAAASAAYYYQYTTTTTEHGKVTICHHTHSQTNPFVTITVSQNAVPAHMRHGDTLGPCPGE